MRFEHYAMSALALLTAGGAQANTITFDDMPYHGFQPFTTYTEDGLTATVTSGQYYQGAPTGGPSAPSSPAILTGFFNATQDATLTITGPSLFQFDSFDYFDGSSDGSTDTFTVAGFLDGVLLYSLSGDFIPNQEEGGSATLVTVSGFNGFTVDEVQISTSANYQLFIDNITATAVEAAPGVPEPATWAMMIAGFGMVGSALRRSYATLQTA